jgi:tetratricopeptide (TPR) repeat protein
MTRRAPLDPATWSRVGDVLDAALAIADATARSHFIEQTCGNDTRLRDEVLSLLSVGDCVDIALPATRWIEHEIGRSGSQAADPVSLVGRELGSWRVDALIATGGMGVVYRGSRADRSFEKNVAVKVLPRSAADAELAGRFAAERHILAALDHPGIARLLDGGNTADGIAWLVMEYAEGEQVDRYCDQGRRSLEHRLALYLAICDAVQYAHQRLVVHRDLKPGNILVAADGSVKLLDFGISAIIADQARDAGTPAPALQAMTPLWASPEQLDGQAVTTASDIYSLGVLLYRLLTGVMPYHTAAQDTPALLREIAGATPTPPSARVAGTGRDRPGTALPYSAAALQGDLDAIILMAMRRRPELRYQTVAQLGDDIRRFLRQEPVVARGDAMSYRAGKFVRRHRGSVALAGAGLFGILLTSAAALYQASVANDARQHADAERARAERNLVRARQLANDSLFAVHDSLRNVPGTTAARALVAEKVSLALDEMARDGSGGNVDLMREAGSSWSRLAIIQSQTAGASTGELASADNSFRRAIEMLAAAFVAEPTRAETAYSLARSLRIYGVYLATSNRVTEAPVWLQRAVTVAAAFSVVSPETRRLRMEASAAASSLAFYARAGSPAERGTRRAHALSARDALEQLNAEALTDAERVELDEYCIYLYGTLAQPAHTADDGRVDWQGALSWVQRALSISQTRAAANPGRIYFAEQVATGHLDVAAVASELKLHELSAQHAAHATDARERLYEADRADAGRLSTFAYALASLAEAQARLPDTGPARATLERARNLLRRVTPEILGQLDMVTAAMGLNAVASRLDGRAAAATRDAATRGALCQSAQTALTSVQQQQARWEAFHKQSLEPELDDIRREMRVCLR